MKSQDLLYRQASGVLDSQIKSSEEADDRDQLFGFPLGGHAQAGRLQCGLEPGESAPLRKRESYNSQQQR